MVARARAVLAQLEEGDRQNPAHSLVDDLPLFSAGARRDPQPAPPAASRVEEMLAALNPDDLTPRDALEAIYALKKAAAG